MATNLFYVMFLLYIIPIIFFIIVDYIRCPKGTTLKNFIKGHWHLYGVDRDFDDPYDAWMYGPFVWLPISNWILVFLWVYSILSKMCKCIHDSGFWEIKIK